MLTTLSSKTWLLRGMWNAKNLYDPSQIQPVVQQNRASLARIPNWIDDDVYLKSIFKYGLPEEIKPLINLPIGNGITYTDIMLYLSRQLTQEINFLELGVSVGKNFYQVMNYLKGATLTGFDIEDINPILQSPLVEVNRVEWPTMADSMKKNPSSLIEFKYPPNGNTVKYLSGDIWDTASWERLAGSKFNCVFSDAFHDPKALLFEADMFLKHKLLNEDEFIMVWDDLGGTMTLAYIEIWHRMKKAYHLPDNSMVMLKLNNWLGENYHKNTIGIIVNTKKRANQ